MVMTLEFAVLFMAMLAVVQRRTGLVERALWWPLPRAAVGLWLSVAVVSALQFIVIGWYDALARDPDQILHHGQIWRLLTAMFVQDGWAAGTTLNLIVLALAAVPAARYFGALAMWLVFLGGGIGFNLLGALFDARGAGNWGPTMGMVCALVGHTAAARPGQRGGVAPPVIALSILPLVVGAAAWAFFGYHGEAEVLGWLIGAALGALAATRFPKARALTVRG